MSVYKKKRKTKNRFVNAHLNILKSRLVGHHRKLPPKSIRPNYQIVTPGRYSLLHRIEVSKFGHPIKEMVVTETGKKKKQTLVNVFYRLLFS